MGLVRTPVGQGYVVRYFSTSGSRSEDTRPLSKNARNHADAADERSERSSAVESA